MQLLNGRRSILHELGVLGDRIRKKGTLTRFCVILKQKPGQMRLHQTQPRRLLSPTPAERGKSASIIGSNPARISVFQDCTKLGEFQPLSNICMSGGGTLLFCLQLQTSQFHLRSPFLTRNQIDGDSPGDRPESGNGSGDGPGEGGHFASTLLLRQFFLLQAVVYTAVIKALG